MKHKTLLIFGGTSDEKMVSVATAQNLVKHFAFDAIWFEHGDGSFSISSREEVLTHERPFEVPFRSQNPSFAKDFQATLPKLREHLVFLGLHGTEGEDGQMQDLLERERIPFVGSGATSSRLCFEKDLAKNLLRKKNLSVAAELILNLHTSTQAEIRSQLSEFFKAHQKIVVKPIASGSSFGLHIVESPSEIESLTQTLAKENYGRYLAESFIEGRELTVGAIEHGGKLIALPASEVVLTGAKFDKFDYEGKYLGRGTKEITPAELSPSEMRSAQELALSAHSALGCYGYSRTDMILTADGPVFLETNTLPGLTKASFIPQQLEAAKIDLVDFIKDQMQLAELRFG